MCDLFNYRILLYLFLPIFGIFGIIGGYITSLIKVNKNIGRLIAILSLSTFFISTITTYIIAFSFNSYFLAHKTEKLTFLSQCEEYTEYLEGFIEKTHERNLKVWRDRTAKVSKMEKVPMRDDLPNPNAMTITKRERSKLLQKTAKLSESIKPYLSNKIERIIQNIGVMLDDPWMACFEFYRNEDTQLTDWTILCSKSKQEVVKIRTLLDGLYSQVLDEIGFESSFKNCFCISTKDKLQFDIRDLEYGTDISVFQDLEELINNVQNESVRLYMFLPKYTKFCAVNKKSNYIYEINKSDCSYIKNGEKYCILAMPSSFEQEPIGYFRLNEKGLSPYDNNEGIKAWVFTPTKAQIIKEGNVWYAIW